MRGLLPGFTYQIGILLAPRLRRRLSSHCATRLGYAWALTAFELVVIAVLAVMLLLGTEQRGRSFLAQDDVAIEGLEGVSTAQPHYQWVSS